MYVYKEHRKHNHNAGYQNGHPIIDIYEVIDNMIAEQRDWALILQVHALLIVGVPSLLHILKEKNSTKGS